MQTALSSIDRMAAIIEPSQEMNFRVWPILGQSVPSQPDAHRQYDTYGKMLERLRVFLRDRSAWMDAAVSNFP